MSPRSSQVTSLEQAVGTIEDGSRVGIGGAVTAGHPMALVRALADSGVKDLTVVAPTAGIEVDLLIACGCVSRVLTCYVGIEGTAPVGPVYRSAVEQGLVETVDLDEAHLAVGLRAAGQGLPFLPWRGGVGTSFPDLNPSLVEFRDPIKGEPLLAIPAIELDVALVYAEIADEYGNAQPVGTGHMDSLLAAAAERVLIQTGEVVGNEVIRQRPELTNYWRDSMVIPAKFGTHPYSDAALIADERHLIEFTEAARGGAETLQQYLDTYILGLDHDTYLERIGQERIGELRL